jgi:hypothetical protein
VFVLLGFRLLCSSGPCVRVEKGFSTCTGTRVADCSWIHYAHINGQSSQPGEAPPDLSECFLERPEGGSLGGSLVSNEVALWRGAGALCVALSPAGGWRVPAPRADGTLKRGRTVERICTI